MKYLCPLIIILLLSGCCQIADPLQVPAEGTYEKASFLYRLRMERAGTTKFSGLLVLSPSQNGMSAVLLDATGIPLVKEKVRIDGSTRLDYCAPPLHATKLPDLLGKLVEYIYLIPARDDCPWYVISCVCRKKEARQTVKWKKIGPFRLWEVKEFSPEQKNKITTVTLNFSSIIAYLQLMDTPLVK